MSDANKLNLLCIKSNCGLIPNNFVYDGSISSRSILLVMMCSKRNNFLTSLLDM